MTIQTTYFQAAFFSVKDGCIRKDGEPDKRYMPDDPELVKSQQLELCSVPAVYNIPVGEHMYYNGSWYFIASTHDHLTAGGGFCRKVYLVRDPEYMK